MSIWTKGESRKEMIEREKAKEKKPSAVLKTVLSCFVFSLNERKKV